MNESLKIIFDECSISPVLVRELGVFYSLDYPGMQLVHLRDKFKLGSKDPVWIKELKDDGDWIIVTADKGVSDGCLHTQKLPRICTELGITHVIMTSTIAKGGSIVHRQAFADVWQMLVKLPLLPKGTKVSLRIIGHGPRRAGLFVNNRSVSAILEELQPPPPPAGPDFKLES